MKLRKIRFSIVSILLVLSILCTYVPSQAFGWFADKQLTPHSAEVMPGFYAGGKGTKDNPYLITKPIHLYNFAWLQQRGTYNPKEGQTDFTQTYFELADNIDMSGYVLPPIGTEKFPFLGNFTSSTGKKFTISNLTVSNVIDNGEIIKRPSGINNITGVEIVGMFGVIGEYNGVPDAQYSSIVPKVENFFLEDVTIRTQTTKSLAGLIAGYVNGKVHEVGVKDGSLVSGQNNATGI